MWFHPFVTLSGKIERTWHQRRPSHDRRTQMVTDFFDSDVSRSSYLNSRNTDSQSIFQEWNTRCLFINSIMNIYHMGRSYLNQCIHECVIHSELSCHGYEVSRLKKLIFVWKCAQYFLKLSQTNKLISIPFHSFPCEAFIIPRKGMKSY